MSIAVAVKKDGVIAVAADSQENFGDRKMLRANHRASKVMKLGSSYLATTGWGLYENILEDYLRRNSAARLSGRRAVFSFFLRMWKDLRKKYTLVNDQPDQDDSSPFADIDSSFLVVNASGIFHVSGNLTVSEFQSYYAVGSGASYALGVLYALYDQRLDAATIARRACEAATAFDIYCGGELDVYVVRGRRKRGRGTGG